VLDEPLAEMPPCGIPVDAVKAIWRAAVPLRQINDSSRFDARMLAVVRYISCSTSALGRLCAQLADDVSFSSPCIRRVRAPPTSDVLHRSMRRRRSGLGRGPRGDRGVRTPGGREANSFMWLECGEADQLIATIANVGYVADDAAGAGQDTSGRTALPS